jgi:hypothetical protein
MFRSHILIRMGKLQNRKSFNFILHVKCMILVIIDLLEIKFLFQIKEE